MLQLLEGKKKVFLQAEAPMVTIPNYREMKVSNILKSVLPNDVIESYLPDKTTKDYKLNQEFVQRIVSKLEPVYFTKLVEAAREARFDTSDIKNKTATIEMNKEIFELLMSKKF